MKKIFTLAAILFFLPSLLKVLPFGEGCGGASCSAQTIAAQGTSLAVCADGTVRSWGMGQSGQLGVNTSGAGVYSTVPLQVHGPGDVGFLDNIIAVAAVGYSSFFLKDDGTVWACGYNGYGQLGDGTTTQRTTPVQVHGPGDVGFLTGITAIEGGDYHALFLKNDGTVWACGRNNKGELGDGTGIGSYTPVQVHGPGDVGFLTGIIAIAGEERHSLFLKNDGTVWGCGKNLYGELGDGSTDDKYTPVQVHGPGDVGFLTGITAIAGGWGHSLFLKNDGTAWGCGYNAIGQLGDGSTTDRITPVQVSGLTGITTIAGGGYFSLFLKNDGTVWACGYNTGSLGDNTFTDRLTPVQVHGPSDVGFLTGITAIDGGNYYSLFLKNDGTVWASGSNTDGPLGDGTTTTRLTPVQSTPLCTVSILPIELLSFDATPVKDSNNKYYVRCEWSTASEINNDYFSIERSKDGKVFANIGTRQGAGNSSITLYYEFDDWTPYTGLSYYRLKQTDYDGKFSYSNIVPVFIGDINLISIAPNPVIDNFEYKIGSTETMSVQVKVVDMLGQIVINKTEIIEKGITSKRLDVSGISSGTYILELITENKEVRGKQFQIK